MLDRQYPATPSALSGHWRYPCFNENWKRSSGLAEMSLIAVSVGGDVVFVGFYHVFSVIAALISTHMLVALFVNNERGRK